MLKTRAALALSLLSPLFGCVEESAEPRTMMDASSATADGGKDGGTPRTDAGTDAGAKLDFSKFDEALEAAIAAHNEANPTKQVRGASAVVVDKATGIVHSQGYGEYAADRLYLVASASKPLSVGVLMRLADQGKLDLDTPISEYLGDWGEHKTNVTVAQLVSNSSGLPSLAEVSGGLTNPALMPHLCQYLETGKLSDCGKVIYSDEVPANNRPPDEVWRYGGSQWQLAGAVAEQVSGKSWADLIQETYVQPCGVESLAYTNPFGKGETGYPAAFDGDATSAPKTANPSIEGGAYITAQDYGTLLWMHLRGGTCGTKRVLSADSVERMQHNRVSGEDGYGGMTSSPALDGYGLGWWTSEAEGIVASPGLYGAYPVIDQNRDYALILLIEVDTTVGGKLFAAAKPELDRVFGGR